MIRGFGQMSEIDILVTMATGFSICMLSLEETLKFPKNSGSNIFVIAINETIKIG